MSATGASGAELAGATAHAPDGEPSGARASGESCPLCQAPLAAEQEWCLRCGAAARTRVASTPRWQTPLVLLLIVAAICVAVLAAALVKLARGSGPAPAPITTTITTTGATGSPGLSTSGASTTSAPATPGAATTTAGATAGATAPGGASSAR